MSLNELKNLHKNFSLINSCFDFSEYLKKLNQNKQLFINNKNENEMILSFTSEYLVNVEIIEIILLPDRINVEKKLKEACNEIEFLKQKIKNLENKNDELKKENVQMINLIYEIINENKKLKENNNYMEDQIFNIKNDIAFLKKNNDNNKKINSPISLMKYKY
jgi:FtsZ-binding cell division protein ZapB